MTDRARIADLVRHETGIAINARQHSSLAAALDRAVPGSEPADVLRSMSDPRMARPLLERLIDEVTVNESFFFRHLGELRSIDWHGLLEAAQSEGREVVRVWSAACAAGEEPYTLAILAAEAFGTAEPPVQILGTDICTPALDQARAAYYSERAVREVPGLLRDRYLEAAGGGFAVAPSLRRLVELRRHNLAAGSPADEDRFDLILCRNVLIYFDPATVARTCGALERALRPHGQLILGAADRLSGTPARAPGERRRAPAKPKPRAARPRPEPRPVRERVEEWSLEATIETADASLASDPLDVDAYFVRGVAQLACGDAAGAVTSLRRALYLDPRFGLAAFKLGRAHEALGEPVAARRAYVRAIKALDSEDDRAQALPDAVNLADVLQACRARVAALPRS